MFLLMVLLSSSDEVKAKAVLVSEQPPSPAEEDVEDAIDALWLWDVLTTTPFLYPVNYPTTH